MEDTATILLLIGKGQKLFKVTPTSGELPDVDQGLIDELQAIEGVAWVNRDYGGTWMGISFEEIVPLRMNEALNFIRKALEQRGLKFEQVNPVRR